MFKFVVKKPETLPEKVAHIQALNKKCADFWSGASGWAPEDAAALLAKSRLDWQVSLSQTLEGWTKKNDLTDGELILAWANLGALIEGSLKLFLSVYYQDFKADKEGLKAARAYDHKKKTHKSPDGLTLDKLRIYALNKKLFNDTHIQLIDLVQQRRNAIHAFKDREIGDQFEFLTAVSGYYDFLVDVEGRLPYP